MNTRAPTSPRNGAAPTTKQQIRDQHAHDIPEQDPPPTRDDIRRELGWTMVEAEREARADGDERN